MMNKPKKAKDKKIEKKPYPRFNYENKLDQFIIADYDGSISIGDDLNILILNVSDLPFVKKIHLLLSDYLNTHEFNEALEKEKLAEKEQD